MSNGDGTTVDVHFFGVEALPERDARERLRGERLVYFNKVHVAPTLAGSGERLVRGVHGRNTKNVGVISRRCPRHNAGKGIAQPGVFVANEKCRSPIAQGTRISCGDRAAGRNEGGLQRPERGNVGIAANVFILR
ncbi:unannotated protein [freshwater metagenome]|uniref:Unannotated protein n=1 Tax=freshwater metagenome TaxID=449393 RepID=A0A6J7H4U2_9ZZZZ